ncbi:MAG: HlyD family efflux transporter periplasmic adaptor subunit [Bauldia sp.]|nr:HlyD family efflux transporter periplasmic adaptor subunit [Bauldia sp.]
MAAKWIKRIIALLVFALIAAGLVYALRPQPVAVDVASLDRGPMEVTIDEEGIARIRDIFRVSAPIPGRVERLPVDVGDTVETNRTVVAAIHPVDPPLLDVRTRRELEAAVEAAKAAVTLAQAQIDSAETNVRLMRSELERARELADRATISVRAFEKASADLETAEARVKEMRAALELRQSELDSAEARLIEPGSAPTTVEACCVTVLAPADGTVLKLLSESEQVVAAGGPLLEIGDPGNLEIIVHLLSSDAVAIEPEALARVDGWGGPELTAKLRRIDPSAYTKVSALGIEEQRVDAIFDIVDPREVWARLGHEFRVMVHIPTWRSDDVLRVPLGALFRRGDAWHVFKVSDGRAAVTPVVIDHRNMRFAEVIDGLAPGDVVVLHPSDRVIDGVALEERDVE